MTSKYARELKEALLMYSKYGPDNGALILATQDFESDADKLGWIRTEAKRYKKIAQSRAAKRGNNVL